MGATDFAVIANGYTVVVTGFSPSYNQGLTINSGGKLQSSGNIDLSSINPSNVSTGGSTLTAAGSFKLGSSTTINGSVVAGSINTNSGDTITGSVTVSGLADLGSNIKINGSLTANAVTTDSPGTIGGAITATTTVDLGSHMTVGGNVSGTTITTISPVSITGNVTATTAFTLASGSTVTGNISAPKVTLNASGSTVTGTISAPTSLDIGSGNTVNGSVTGGALTMRASNGVINGSVTMTGDVDLGSGSSINGDLSARDVTMHASGAAINGNASVNSIYIDWGDVVTKTITCTGPGASGCSCVTKANPSYNPTCGAPPPAIPDHFQINHSGSALTCQAQTVTVIACANANCTTRYTGNVNTTLQPGGQTFTISGGINNAATVRSATAGPQPLSASGATNTTTCVNSGGGKPCEMNFQAAGLTVTATNHVSMTSGAVVTIEALKDDPAKSVCVPLATGPANIDMACSYKNPASGSVNVGFDTKSAACGPNTFGTTVSVPVTFDANGKATVPLQYADVGRIGVSARYVKSGLNYMGNGEFIAAPAKFLVTATNASATIKFGPAALSTMPPNKFVKASEAFNLSIQAVNSNNDTPVPNFGKESPASKIKVILSKNDPASAPVPAGTGQNGVLTTNFSAFSNGLSTTTASFDDVGYLKIDIALDDGANNYGYYLAEPRTDFQTAGKQYVARFYPDHFDTALMTTDEIKAVTDNNTHMSCDGLADSKNPCKITTVATSFVNSRQPFFMKVLAYNGAGALTKNYAGALAKTITVSAMKAKGGDDQYNTAPDAITWSNDAGVGRFTFNAGVGMPTKPASGSPNLPAFKFASAYPAVSDPAVVYLRAEDTDTSSKRSPPDSSVEAPLNIVSGRLLVANAYGSPTAPLKVEARAQYFMPNPTGYVFNPQVNDTSVDKVNDYISYSNCQNKLRNSDGSCKTINLADTSAVLKLENGLGTFRLAAPVPVITGVGSVDVALKNATDSLFRYLPSTTGKETFGIYRSGPVIYTREIY
jgi:MSHA biogenesis protein MshQ